MAHRLLLPARTRPAGGDGVSRFSRMEFLCMLGVFDSGGPRLGRVIAAARCCLPYSLTPSAPRTARFRSSIPSLQIPLSNASSTTLPPPSHGSGPEWFATPSLYDSFIRYSMPVYPGAIQTIAFCRLSSSYGGMTDHERRWSVPPRRLENVQSVRGYLAGNACTFRTQNGSPVEKLPTKRRYFKSTGERMSVFTPRHGPCRRSAIRIQCSPSADPSIT